MKNLFLLIVLLFLSITTEAQNTFAPIGATWTYKYWTDAGDTSLHTCYLKSVADTIVLGKQCKIMKKNASGCDLSPLTEYMYSDSGRVYFFDNSFGTNSFLLLFDINVNVGEYYSTNFGGIDSIVYFIDSVSIININGFFLKELTVHCTHHPISLSVSAFKIIENIGSSFYMFPWHNVLCNESIAGPLGCYSDTIIGFYDFGTISECTSGTTSGNSFSIFPNPTSGIFTVTVDSSSANVSVFNILGQLIQTKTLSLNENKLTFDLSSVPRGIYFLRLKTEKKSQAQKIFVE